jgi:hypothetical protein
MLGGELTAAPGGHADDQRNAELTAGHVAEGGGVVHDLVEGEEAEVDGHHLDDRSHPAERRSDTGPDEGRLRQRGVVHALGAELREQPVADGEGAAIAADVLAHQEDARVRSQRVAQRRPHGLAIAHLLHGVAGV